MHYGPSRKYFFQSALYVIIFTTSYRSAEGIINASLNSNMECWKDNKDNKDLQKAVYG